MRYILALLIATVTFTGCAMHGHPQRLPGCPDAYVYVQPGCYAQNLPDRVEVRCPKSTTKYKNCLEAHR